MTGRVNKVERIIISVMRGILHLYRMTLYGNPPLTFERHIVENLVHHLALGNCTRALQQAIGQGGFAVVYMSDNTEISNKLGSPDLSGSLRYLNTR